MRNFIFAAEIVLMRCFGKTGPEPAGMFSKKYKKRRAKTAGTGLTPLTGYVIVENALLWQQVPLSLYALIFRRGQERSGTLYLFTNSKSQEVNRQWRKTGYVRSAAEEVYE